MLRMSVGRRRVRQRGRCTVPRPQPLWHDVREIELLYVNKFYKNSHAQTPFFFFLSSCSRMKREAIRRSGVNNSSGQVNLPFFLPSPRHSSLTSAIINELTKEEYTTS